jgi:arylsulfatase A-like enzyme
MPRPNVLVVICDDVGYGDLGAHGNDDVRTPNLDSLYGDAARLTRFYGGPVCSPSRASLLTGRYSYRTGVVDTWLGRSMMHPDETTLADRLGEAGYRTGIFGKWHLGDEYPLRPTDQGFDETLVHRGGGIGQPGDFPGNEYTDPTLVQNGDPVETEGYCTDVYGDAAEQFVRECAGEDPFFAYVGTNAPHVPLQVPEEYVEPYRGMGLDESVARVYAMVENVDENVGRLLDALEDAGEAENTVVVFTSDHGPQHVADGPRRYNAGLRGCKGDPYEGGIRVPFLVRWPEGVESGDRDTPAHFVDVLPTVLDAVGEPAGEAIDGESILPLLTDGTPPADRTLFVQWHRGDEPVMYRNSAVVGPEYKLVNGRELYDIGSDPGEQRDLAAEEPAAVERLRSAYADWYGEMAAERGFEPPRIGLGAAGPTLLTPQDWRGPGRDDWSDEGLGHWLVDARPGRYDVTLRLRGEGGQTRLRCGDTDLSGHAARGVSAFTFEDVDIDGGPATLEAWVENSGRNGVNQVVVKRVDR